MKKLTRKNLDELAKVMPVLSDQVQRNCIGGETISRDDWRSIGVYQYEVKNNPIFFGINTYEEYLAKVNSLYCIGGASDNYIGGSGNEMWWYSGGSGNYGENSYEGGTYVGGTDGNYYYSSNNNNTTINAPSKTKFEKLSFYFNDLAKMTSDKVYKKIGGKVAENHSEEPEKYANACALRMSYALNSMGITIPYIKGETGSGDIDRDNIKEWYFYRVADVQKFIESKFGKFQKVNSLEDIKDKKGFISYDDCVWNGKHIDVWDGTTVLSNDYRDQCDDLYFLEIK